MQKIFEASETCQGKAGTASGVRLEGQTFMWITENNAINNPNMEGYDLLEFILSPSNLNKAYQSVKRNKGAGGIDKMEVESLRDYFVEYKDSLINAILTGNYRPNPVRRVSIPKDGGKKRNLGIPTVVDRVIQQAIFQEVSKLYEPQFSAQSYGFRPGRSGHQALEQSRKYLTEGYEYAVDMDMEKFFDTVNHSKLIELLSQTIKDKRVISLIHRYLNAGVQTGERYERSDQGLPQGGPLSPLLSNVLLNELDKELAKRGHKFVRYADDFLIFCKSKRSSERVMRSVTKFIEGRLYLRVNRAKSHTRSIEEINFLGYSFYKIKEKVGLRLSPTSTAKIKAKLRELTSRSNGWGNERRKETLSQYIRGWVNYYKLADMKSALLRIDEWYRRRLRMVIWKQWKRPGTRKANLVKLGVRESKAREWSNTRKGYWHTANSHILSTTITNERLRKAGYIFLSDYYQTVKVVN